MVKLTPRQTQIAALVGEGLTEPEIAAQLNVSRNTVRNHKAAIYQKLGVSNAISMIRRLEEAA